MKLGTRSKLVALAATGALTLASCAGGGDADGAPATGGASTGGTVRGGSLTLGTVADVTSFDPGQAHVGHSLQMYQPAYDTLILREPDGTFSPMLATGWGYTDETNTTFSLDLRTDVTFSDGAPFDADAAKANLDHFKAANGPQGAQLAAVEEVTAVDEDTVEITLAQPDPALEYYLSQAAGLMGSPEALGTDEIARTPVGTGPYVMDTTASVVGSQYVFTAREDYWNPDLQKFDQLVLKPLIDVTARVNALVSGQVDATLLDARTVDQAKGAGMTMLDYAVDWQGLLLFDREGELAPALADVRVRQAINHAFDKETILEQLQGGYGEVTSQVFGPESGAYLEELEDAYPYDLKKAEALMAEAGYEDGFTLTMPVATGLEAIMPFIVQSLADIDITVQQESVPSANFVTDLGAGKFAATWFSLFQGVPWVAINQMVSTEALYNPFDSTDPELQEMVEAVRTGGEDSAELAQDVNRYVTENAWFVPWFRPAQIFFVDAEVTAEPQVQQAVPSIYNFSPVS